MLSYLVTPLGDIRAAVTTLIGGLVHHRTYDGPTWDRSVATLAAAHEQLGGDTRRLLYQAFAATRPDSDDDLDEVLGQLAADLDITDPGPDQGTDPGRLDAAIVPR